MKNNKKQPMINGRLLITILVGLTFLSIILIAMMLSVPNNTQQKKKSITKNIEEGQKDVKEEKEVMAVVKEINADETKIILYDVMAKEELLLTYNGLSSIEDKYNQMISIQQIPIGSMVDVFYGAKDQKISHIQISTKAWEYAGVNNLTVDETSKEMKIASTKYRYHNDITVVDLERFIGVKDLTPQDELTVRGYEEMIWSITVTRGHGTLLLVDDEAYVNGNIAVGYQAMQPIKEDMRINVREGTFNMTVENGKYSGVKSVTIERNKETTISLAGLGPEAIQKSLVTFTVSPYGAELTIAGEVTSYEEPIELAYGSYPIVVSLGGYQNFTGTLIVNTAGKVVHIDLPEVSSEADAQVSVDNSEDGDTNTDADTTDEDNSETVDWVPVSDSEGSDSDEVEEDIDPDHFIYVQNPVGASVYINGEFKGISPGSFAKQIGSHVITFIKEGYLTQSYTIEIEDDGLDTFISLPDLVEAR